MRGARRLLTIRPTADKTGGSRNSPGDQPFNRQIHVQLPRLTIIWHSR